MPIQETVLPTFQKYLTIRTTKFVKISKEASDEKTVPEI
jgi:hypothetical protein